MSKKKLIELENIKRGTVLVHNLSGPGLDLGYEVVINSTFPHALKTASIDRDISKLRDFKISQALYIEEDMDVRVVGYGPIGGKPIEGRLGDLRDEALTMWKNSNPIGPKRKRKQKRKRK